jgi:hypothetical protein
MASPEFCFFFLLLFISLSTSFAYIPNVPQDSYQQTSAVYAASQSSILATPFLPKILFTATPTISILGIGIYTTGDRPTDLGLAPTQWSSCVYNHAVTCRDRMPCSGDPDTQVSNEREMCFRETVICTGPWSLSCVDPKSTSVQHFTPAATRDPSSKDTFFAACMGAVPARCRNGCCTENTLAGRCYQPKTRTTKVGEPTREACYAGRLYKCEGSRCMPGEVGDPKCHELCYKTRS